MSSVMLDGKLVNHAFVTPDKATFIGMWRPPVNPFSNPTCDILCNCGNVLKYSGEEREHYLRGCFDVPHYISRKDKP